MHCVTPCSIQFIYAKLAAAWMSANSDMTVVHVHGLMSAVSSEQREMLVDTDDISASQACSCSLFRSSHDKAILSLMLAFAKASFSQFNSFLITLFLFVVCCSF